MTGWPQWHVEHEFAIAMLAGEIRAGEKGNKKTPFNERGLCSAKRESLVQTLIVINQDLGYFRT